MGDTLQLTGAGSAMSLHSSAPALLHALRPRCPGDTAPYLNQARAIFPGGVSELDAALHLLHPPDEDLEVGQITVFVEGADKAPTRSRLTNPVYDGTRPTPRYAVMCEAFPREPTWCPALQPTKHTARGWANPNLSPPRFRTRGQPQRAGPLARAPGHPPAPPRRRHPRGPGAGPRDHPHSPVRGSLRTPPPPPGARGAGRGTHLPANTGGHRRYGGLPSAAPLGTIHPTPGGPGP